MVESEKHIEMKQTAKILLKELFGETVEENPDHWGVDLLNKEVGVEVGFLTAYTSADRDAKIKARLTEFKTLYWLPYPEQKEFMGLAIPIYRCYIFERKDQDIVVAFEREIKIRDEQIERLRKIVAQLESNFIGKLKNIIDNYIESHTKS